MKGAEAALILCVLITGYLPHRSVQAQHNVSSSVLGNGGAVISGSHYRMIGTLGQSAIGVVGSPSIRNQAGYWYHVEDVVTSVEAIPDATLPKQFRLDQNYPNPFNPATTIQFALPERSQVTLRLFDFLGREVAILLDGDFQPGEFKVAFDAESLASGLYLYRLEAGGFVQTRKMTLLQ